MLHRSFVALLLLASGGTAAAFPADGDWQALGKGAQCAPIFDGAADTNTGAGTRSRDFVGTPAAKYFVDATTLWIRLRVRENPRSGGSNADPNDIDWGDNFGWGCQISDEADASDWEAMVLADGESSVIRITDPNAPSIVPANSAGTFTQSINMTTANARVVQAPVDPNDPDPNNPGWFIDFAVPLSNLALNCGSNIQLVCGSNSNRNATLTTGNAGDIIGIGNISVPAWSTLASCSISVDGCAESGLTCIDNMCQANVECMMNDDCAPDSNEPVCGETGNCGGCTAGDPGGCPMVGDGNNPACATEGPATGACVQCNPDDVVTVCTNAGKVCHPFDANDPFSYTCVDCLTDAQCDDDPNKPICQDADHTCAGCTGGGECVVRDPNLPVCQLSSGRCVECDTSADCTNADKPICNPAGACVPCDDPSAAEDGCQVKNDPNTADPNTPVCNADNGRCVECVSDNNCTFDPNEPYCIGNSCGPCTDQFCENQGLVCNGATGLCVACLDGPTDCYPADPNAPICDLVGHTCEPCMSNTECEMDYGDVGRPSCVMDGNDPRDGQCVPCTPDSIGVCDPNSQVPVCGTTTHTCVQCNVNPDCVALGDPLQPQCGDANNPNTCVGCTDDPGCDGNPVGEVCQHSTGRCGECEDDDDCDDPNEPVCDTQTRTCVRCNINADCTGQVCDSHQCVPGCDTNDDCIARDANQPVCNAPDDANDPLSGQCTECSIADPNDIGVCGTATGGHLMEPFCLAVSNPTDEICVGCRTTSDCTGGKVCITSSHTCEECDSQEDCRDPNTAFFDPNQPFCDLELPVPVNSCVPNCPGNYACPIDTLPVCQLTPSPIFGKCTECSEGQEDFCTTTMNPMRPHCDFITGMCVECTLNSQCPSNMCNTGTGLCVVTTDAGPDAPPPVDAGVPDAAPPVFDAAPVPDGAVIPDAAVVFDAPPSPPDAMPAIDAAPAVDGAVVPDARVFDATPAIDAAPSVADARPADARQIDARVEPLVGGFLEGGGCDCRTGSSGGTPSGSAWLLLGALGVIITIRRRRR